MFRGFLLIAFLGAFASCAKKVALPEITVSAADAGEFSRFRSDLDGQFPPEQLQDFDTAVQELKLDAINRDIATVDAREQDMLAMVNGKSVHAVMLLGWQARHDRFLREIAFMSGLLENELKVRQKSGADAPSSAALARIQSAQNVIAQIQVNAAATDRRLAELRAAGGK